MPIRTRLLGDLTWRNYTVSSDVMLEKSGYAQLIGRGNTYNHQGPQNLNGYYFRVTDTGAWSIQSNNTSGNRRTLASGTVPALGIGRWHTLSLTVNGSTLTAAIDGTTVGRATDATWVAGQIGYGTGQGVTAQFDNLSITPVGGSGGPTGEVRGAGSNRCLDVNGASQADGAIVQIWDCNGGANQQWTAHVQQPAHRLRQQVSRRARHLGRNPRADLDLHRRHRPAMAGQSGRHHRRRRIRTVPGRQRRRHRQRHRGADLDLQRRQQPVMDPRLG